MIPESERLTCTLQNTNFFFELITLKLQSAVRQVGKISCVPKASWSVDETRRLGPDNNNELMNKIIW